MASPRRWQYGPARAGRLGKRGEAWPICIPGSDGLRSWAAFGRRIRRRSCSVRRVLRELGLQIPAASEGLAREAGHRAAKMENGDSCARLLLAWPHLLRGPCSETQSRVLGAQAASSNTRRDSAEHAAELRRLGWSRDRRSFGNARLAAGRGWINETCGENWAGSNGAARTQLARLDAAMAGCCHGFRPQHTEAVSR